MCICLLDTIVDGRNPAPVDGYYSIPLFTGLFTSQVVQDFFLQQYVVIPCKGCYIESSVVKGMVELFEECMNS